MTIYEERQRQKELRRQYKAIAKRQYLQPDDECSISIDDHAVIKIMEDGAFIKAIIWVPLPKETL